MSNSTITLYATPLSGHAHRVEQLLLLLGLEYGYSEANAGVRATPEFLALNPLGQIPVLRDGDLVLLDSNAIMVYLVGRYAPDSGWIPADALGAARMQRWLSVAAGELCYGPAAARVASMRGQPEVRERAQTVARRILPVLDQELSTRAFLAADTPTLADLACYAYVAVAPEGGLPLAPFPHLRAWIERLEAMPGFKPMQRSPELET
ncbi:MAG: glutathione S-transferase [Pseudomonadota bacterium]